MRITYLLATTVLIVTFSCFYLFGRSLWAPALRKVSGNNKTVDEVISVYGKDARERLLAHFNKANANYPPKNITLLAIKNTAMLELWSGTKSQPTYIRSYSIQALSGDNGPKLIEGDGQVPEGLYKIIGLNPNSSYHLSMKLNYPNEFDLIHARTEGRDSPGTNIFIHGKARSIGCLAMGDEVIEELFVMAADVGKGNIDITIAPSDPRIAALTPISALPWTEELYIDITDSFSHYLHKPD